MTVCPHCLRDWPRDSEQGICTELFGECICCRFTPPKVVDPVEISQIRYEYQQRKHEWEWVKPEKPHRSY